MKKAFTMLELMIAITVVAILVSIGVANYTKTRVGAFNREAISQLRLIYHTEKLIRSESGSYITCNNAMGGCVNALGLKLDTAAGWNYCVGANASGFCASAIHRYGNIASISSTDDTVTGGNCATPCW